MKQERLRNGMQNLLAEAGESACYALCLIDVAIEYSQKKIDIVNSLISAIERGYIIYKWDDRNFDDNFYVQYPALFLEMMTGKKWSVTKEPPYYNVNKGDFVICRWERNKTGTVSAHFNRMDFEPILNSVTVQHGTVKSLRVCRVLNP